jgi:hypothetical protein
MIHDGLPPTITKPPIELAGPAWWLLPGGDPFKKYERYYPEFWSNKSYWLESETVVGDYPDYRKVRSLLQVQVCGRCGAVIADEGLHDGACP